jgi:Uncharacterized protein conserved in bacteria (DUF2188)
MSTNIKVAPNEVDGWDVVREGEDVALTNVATKQEAEQAAHLFAEHEDDAGEIEVERKPIQPGVGGEDQGVRTYFVGLVALLIAALILIVIAAVVSAALNI